MTITKTIELLKAGEIQIHFDNGNKNHLQKLLSMAFPNGDYVWDNHRYFTNTPESATPMNSSRKIPFKDLLIINLSDVVGLDLNKGDKCQAHFGCSSGWCDATYIGYLNGKIVVENCNGVLTDSFCDLRLSEVTQEERPNDLEIIKGKIISIIDREMAKQSYIKSTMEAIDSTLNTDTFQNGERVEVNDWIKKGLPWVSGYYIGRKKDGDFVIENEENGAVSSGIYCRRPKVEEELTADEIIDLIFSKLPLTEQTGIFRNRLRFLIVNIK